METSVNEKSRLFKAGLVLSVILSVYFVSKIITEVKGYSFIGGGVSTSNTMAFDATGEISASPDIATVSFTIKEESKEVKDAQTKVTTKEKAVLDFLDKSGVAKKDIKTESYSTYPKYDYTTSCTWVGGNCIQQTPKITGYEVSEYISVKIRDLTQAGDVVKGIGAVGISEMTGPNFSIEKEDQLKAQARKIAIDKAKAKAELLAKDLGVKLVRIVSFYENGDYAIPMYANKAMTGAADSISAPSPAPALPTGENKITSSVTITYEIR